MMPREALPTGGIANVTRTEFDNESTRRMSIGIFRRDAGEFADPKIPLVLVAPVVNDSTILPGHQCR
jgi:hypothetical protein